MRRSAAVKVEFDRLRHMSKNRCRFRHERRTVPIRTAVLLCCWLGLAACSSETPDAGEGIPGSENEQTAEPVPAVAGESPTATVIVDGETYEISGNGSCRLIGSRSADGPDGVLEIQIKTPDNERYVQVLRGQEMGLLVAFHKADTPLGSWADGFAPEDDPSEFDGRRFTFEGPVVADPTDLRRTTMRMEVDCPSVEDLTD